MSYLQLKVTGSGSFKTIGAGSYDVGGRRLIKVSDIIANNNEDYTEQNYPTSTKNAPIIYDGFNFKYYVDGTDGAVYDSTTFSAVGFNPVSDVEFEGISGSKFFENDNDTINFKINWRNDNTTGQFFVNFSTKSVYDQAYSNTSHIFARMRIVGDDNLNWVMGFPTFNGGFGHPSNRIGLNNDVIDALKNSKTSHAVTFRVTRLNNSQLKIDVLDYKGDPFPNPQTPFICNSPTSQFTGSELAETNNAGLFVNDITHIYTTEDSPAQIDYVIE